MRTFLDDNQKWDINLTWDKAEQIASRCERPDSTPEERKTFDLFNLTDKEQADAFVLNDPFTGRFDVKKGRCIVNILYVLCEEQCRERNMSDVDFGKMMMSGTFGRAWAALMEEVGNFIQDAEQRMLFQNMLCLAGGDRSTALSEANRILTQKLTASRAMQTRIMEEGMETAFGKVMEALEKAAEESGTTGSLKSAADSALSPTN